MTTQPSRTVILWLVLVPPLAVPGLFTFLCVTSQHHHWHWDWLPHMGSARECVLVSSSKLWFYPFTVHFQAVILPIHSALRIGLGYFLSCFWLSFSSLVKYPCSGCIHIYMIFYFAQVIWVLLLARQACPVPDQFYACQIVAVVLMVSRCNVNIGHILLGHIRADVSCHCKCQC